MKAKNLQESIVIWQIFRFSFMGMKETTVSVMLCGIATRHLNRAVCEWVQKLYCLS